MTNRSLVAVLVAVVVLGLVVLNLGQREPATATAGANPAVGDGNLTVYLFEDYQCSHCRDYALSPAFDAFLERWVEGGNVTLVFKHLAFIGPHSADAARASHCVYGAAPDAWLGWDHDVYLLQAEGRSPTPTELAGLAQDHGVDVRAYTDCLRDEERLDEAIAQNHREFDEAGARGTPSLLVAGQVFNPATQADAVDAAIEAALRERDAAQ